MSEQDNLKAAKSFFEAWNAGDLSKAALYEDASGMHEAPGTAGALNNHQNRMYNQNFLTAFPGSKFQIVLTVMQGDYVVLHWKITGAHTGPLGTPSGGSVPPTGKTATVMGSTTYHEKRKSRPHVELLGYELAFVPAGLDAAHVDRSTQPGTHAGLGAPQSGVCL